MTKPMKPAVFLSNAIVRARRSFKTQLVDLQLGESSFLYEQRRFLLDHDQLSWIDAADNEKRFLKHLKALEWLTREDDIEIESLIEDPGGLHTAVCLFCRQGRFEALRDLAAKADLTDDDVFHAVADGLKQEAPEMWRGRLLQLPFVQTPRGVDLSAVVFGYRRWPLQPILKLCQGRVSPDLIWAIGRSGGAQGIELLRRIIAGDDDSLKTDASISLLRWGSTDHLRGVFPITSPHHWAWLPLGLSGRKDIEERLLRLAAVTPSADVLLSIGLLGRPAAVDRLIARLSHETLGKYAGTALQLITGADLFESVFVPDDIDPDTLTEDELDRWYRGEPLTASGEMPGETVERLSLNPVEWQRWWHDNRSRFNPHIPYRLGKPYSPYAPVDMLASPRSSHLIRALAYEELAIRYRVDLAFETDLSVDRQRHILSAFKQRLDDRGEIAVRHTVAGSL